MDIAILCFQCITISVSIRKEIVIFCLIEAGSPLGTFVLSGRTRACLAELCLPLTLFPTAYIFRVSHGEWWNPSPYGKSASECLSPILFYSVPYSYIDSLNPKGQVSSLKTLEMSAAGCLAANLTNTLKI